MNIPHDGMTKDLLFETLNAYKAKDLVTHGGRTWAYVFDPGREEIEAVAKQAYTMFMSENGLDPTAFPSVLRMENEVVSMAASHLGGGLEVSGNFTSGGTESCLLAVKTARDFARACRPEITEPEMVVPVTGHAAFHKAAHYFGVKAVTVQVDTRTFKADVDAVERAISGNTVLLVGSAPGYAHGVIDPIPELGEVARRHDLLFHVDGCIGGFLLPLFKELGAPVPPFGFEVPGVTSISMDFHKYAFCPKGASVVLYRDKSLRRHQIFACAEWTGYTVVNPTIQSTKSAGHLSSTWAVMNFIGRKGYLELAAQILEASRALIEGINGVPDLRVLGSPDMSLIAFASKTVNVFHVVDEMTSRGWHIQPQLAYAGSPPSIHLTVTPVNLQQVEPFLSDLRDSVEAARSLPSSPMVAMVRQAASQIDPADLTPEMLQQFMSMAGASGTDLPERTATINEILNALPRPLTGHILTEFFNELFLLKEA